MDWEQGEESQNLEDRRRISPKTIAVGGGIGAVIITLVAVFLGVSPDKLNQIIGGAGGGGGGEGGGEQRPLTEQEERTRRFSSKILRFTEKVWDEQFKKAGKRYEPPHMVLFSKQVQTRGCGTAPSAVGPFYCPADRTVYLDPTFFDELEQKLGGSKAEFSQAYVIAHEVGHHVQNLLGYSDKLDEKRRTLRNKAEYNRWSVRLELQADYLAGVWAHYGQMKWKFLEPGDVESAIKTANAIGDDRLQRRSGGFVSPEKFTHGTSEQRMKWFNRGLKSKVNWYSGLQKIWTMPYDEL
jgi:predicted metalloprotease